MPKRSPRKSRQTIYTVSESELLTKLFPKQKQLLAEILGNVAVAWFTIGVISPFFLGAGNFTQVLPSVGGSVLISVFFVYLALRIIKEAK